MTGWRHADGSEFHIAQAARLARPHATWWMSYALQKPVAQPKERDQRDQSGNKSGSYKAVCECCCSTQSQEMAMHLWARRQVFAQGQHVCQGSPDGITV